MCCQIQTHSLVEVHRGLVRREAQIGGSDLDQFATRTEASQRQRRIGAASDHQVRPRREMVEQEDHAIMNVASVDDVVVVEHQHQVR